MHQKRNVGLYSYPHIPNHNSIFTTIEKFRLHSLYTTEAQLLNSTLTDTQGSDTNSSLPHLSLAAAVHLEIEEGW